MTQDQTDILRKLVNSSGFAFQLAVEDRIRRIGSQWEILGREHPWTLGEETGFIDLLAGYGIIRIVIECKRPRDADWIFLLPTGHQKDRSHCNSLWADHHPSEGDLLTWEDFQVAPSTVELEFCVIRGTGEGDRSLLERLAWQIVRSAEALAAEELLLSASRPYPETFIYTAVLLTTARLFACEFDPATVDPANGLLPTGDFRQVPAVRFRKTLDTGVPPGLSVESIGAVSKLNERTVLVVQAANLEDWLSRWSIDVPGGWCFATMRRRPRIHG